MQQLDRLVYLTLAYSAYFAYPLTLLEIQQRLVSSDDVEFLFAKKQAKLLKNNFSLQQIRNSLKKLIKQGLINFSDGYYFLSKQHLESRLQKQKFIAEKEVALADLQRLLKRIPFIKAAAMTGATAVDNAKRFDDLDILIISQSGTLWLTRLTLVLISKWKNKRPFKSKNAWCFNLFLDEDDLKIRPKRRSLYEAYEMMQMRFFYDPKEIGRKMINVNLDWLQKYLCYYQDLGLSTKKVQSEVFEKSGKVTFLNQLFFFLQRFYRRLNFGLENFDLSLNQAFFNQVNFRFKLYSHLKKQLAKLL